MSWMEEERDRRLAGVTRPLSQSQHAQMNARYPGSTLEYCCACEQPTGNAGGSSSNNAIDGSGPYCWECFQQTEATDD